MPLDVQPLSRARHAAMLVVLLVLMLASLGFAQLLIGARHFARNARQPLVQVSFTLPKGLVEPVPEYEKLDGAVLSGEGDLPMGRRRFVAFAFDAPDVLDQPDGLLMAAYEIFERVTGVPIDEEHPIEPQRGRLANRPAIQLESEFGTAPTVAFAVERVTAASGRVVAICYSGTGAITDADNDLFETLCAGVAIRMSMPSASPPRKTPQ